MAKPQYLNRNGFTVVVTPHFQKQWQEARYGNGMQTMAETGADFQTVAQHFDFLNEVSQSGTCGSSIEGSGAIIYYRSVYNNYRNRRELELISVTPDNHFNTRGHSSSGHNHRNTRRIKLP